MSLSHVLSHFQCKPAAFNEIKPMLDYPDAITMVLNPHDWLDDT